MTPDFEKYPQRKNPRLRGYDYSSENYYFVTICSGDKECIFGRTDKLNQYGEWASQGMEEISQHYPDVIVDKFVVMPNHVHAIIYIKDKKANLSRVIGSYKSYVAKKIHEIEPGKAVWQASFHDHIIRNEKSYHNIWQYIEGNPINWEKDCFYTE